MNEISRAEPTRTACRGSEIPGNPPANPHIPRQAVASASFSARDVPIRVRARDGERVTDLDKVRCPPRSVNRERTWAKEKADQ